MSGKEQYEPPTFEELGDLVEMTEATGTGTFEDGAAKTAASVPTPP